MVEPRLRSEWGRILLALGLLVLVTSLAALGLLVALGINADPGGTGAGPQAPPPPLPPDVLAGLLAVQALAAAVVVVFMAGFIDRRPLEHLTATPGSGARWTGSVWGLLLGIILGSAVVLFIAVGGGRHLRPQYFGECPWPTALAVAAALFLVSFTEEWFMRGYVYVNLRGFTSAGRTVILTGLLFAAFHATNPGGNFLSWLNVFLVGIVLAQLREVTGGLFVPAGLHAGWNLTLGMLYGVQVSGVALPSALRVSIEDLPLALGGGTFGPEASLVVTVLFAGVALVLARRLTPPPEASFPG